MQTLFMIECSAGNGQQSLAQVDYLEATNVSTYEAAATFVAIYTSSNFSACGKMRPPRARGRAGRRPEIRLRPKRCPAAARRPDDSSRSGPTTYLFLGCSGEDFGGGLNPSSQVLLPLATRREDASDSRGLLAPNALPLHRRGGRVFHF